MKHILIKLIKIYQIIPGPWHYSCKFVPTCSNYAIEAIDKYGSIKGLLMKTNDTDINSLKSIADSLISTMDEGFIFFANVKDDGNVNFIARSNSFVNAGLIVKDASISSGGNGGGSLTFAQGGGKNADNLDKVFDHIEKVLKDGE